MGYDKKNSTKVCATVPRVKIDDVASRFKEELGDETRAEFKNTLAQKYGLAAPEKSDLYSQFSEDE